MFRQHEVFALIAIVLTIPLAVLSLALGLIGAEGPCAIGFSLFVAIEARAMTAQIPRRD